MSDRISGQRRYAVTVPLQGMAGALVTDVAEDMIAVAEQLRMPVTLDMNGAHLIAFPQTTLGDLRGQYEAQVESPHPVKLD